VALSIKECKEKGIRRKNPRVCGRKIFALAPPRGNEGDPRRRKSLVLLHVRRGKGKEIHEGREVAEGEENGSSRLRGGRHMRKSKENNYYLATIERSEK